MDHYYTQGWKAINSHWDMPRRLDAAFPADRPAAEKTGPALQPAGPFAAGVQSSSATADD
jgi:hypothetical protein